MARFAWGRCRLGLCLVYILWFSVCYRTVFVINKENIYCALKCTIFSFLNKCLWVPVLPNIILITFFCILKIVMLWCISPQYNSTTHNWVKQRVVNYFQCRIEHMWFNISNYITSSAQFFYEQFNIITLRQNNVNCYVNKFCVKDIRK